MADEWCAGTDGQEDLKKRTGRNICAISAGDFGDSPEHEKCCEEAVENWDKSLPNIKELAEKQHLAGNSQEARRMVVQDLAAR